MQVNSFQWAILGYINAYSSAAFQYVVFIVSFKRKDKATTLGEISKVKIIHEQTINAALLCCFKSSMYLKQTREVEKAEVMSFELSPFLPALFEARNVFRKAEKPQLAHVLTDQCRVKPYKNTEQYVLGGGSLVHRIPWKTGDSYGRIKRSYADFTTPPPTHTHTLFGSANVVFDGYGGEPSINDNTHHSDVGRMPIQLSDSMQTQYSQARRMSFYQETAISRDSKVSFVRN